MFFRYIAIFLFSLIAHAGDIRSIDPRDAEKTLSSKYQNSNFDEITALVYQTNIGMELKPYIDELLSLGKIKLIPLKKGHYGESGEGCVIKNNRYFYEGVFIYLNQNLSVPELASSLIHETSHYILIKTANMQKKSEPVSIGWLEISAFATQYEFNQELDKLQLTHSQNLFKEDAKVVSDILQSAYNAKSNPSEELREITLRKLIEFGYSSSELSRNLIIRNERECKGPVFLFKQLNRVAYKRAL